MKKILPILIVSVLFIVIILIFFSILDTKKTIAIEKNNYTKKPLLIQKNHYKDTQCGMSIKTIKYSAQAVSPDGRTWFFDDTGCLALWYKNIKFKDHVIIWVFSNDTNKYINGKKAWYSKRNKTPKEYGLSAYKNKKEGMITFNEMLIKVYNNISLRNLKFKKILEYS